MVAETRVSTPPNSWLYRPQFPEDWSKEILYSLAQWTNGMAFRNIDFSDIGRPVIKIAEVKGGISGQTKFTDAEYDSCYFTTTGDMLFAWSGQPETSIDVYWWRGPEGWLNQHIFKVEPYTDKCGREFFYYLLKYLKPNFIAIAHNKQTTGLGHVTRKDLENIEVKIPSKSIQDTIAHILGTLDDKIELNRRMNETLEAIARALFKSWFVDFDPVIENALRAGNPIPEPLVGPTARHRELLAGNGKTATGSAQLPSRVSADKAALFLDSFQDSPLGPIPEGWKVQPLPQSIDFLEGPGIRHWQYTNSEEGTRFINIRCIQGGDLMLKTANRISDHEAHGKYKHFLLREKDIVVSTSGTLGRYSIVRNEHLPLMLNTSVIRMRPIDPICTLPYLVGFIGSNLFQSELEIRASGSVQKNFGPMHLKQMHVLAPPRRILKAHKAVVGPLIDLQCANLSENVRLAATLDALLPKLLSGELRIPDPKKFLERL